MKQKQIKNLGASVRNRLLNLAKQSHLDFNRLLLLYFQEKFLHRLARSQYKSSFVLKGGALLYSAHQMKARPTKDLDFLATNIKNAPEAFARIIEEIITTILPEQNCKVLSSQPSEIGKQILLRSNISSPRRFTIIRTGKNNGQHFYARFSNKPLCHFPKSS